MFLNFVCFWFCRKFDLRLFVNYALDPWLKVRTVLCGRLADLLRVRSTNTSQEPDADVTRPKFTYISDHHTQNGNGHVPAIVDNNDVSAMDQCVDQKDTNSLESTSDALCNVRDLMETSDLTHSASASSSAAAAEAAAEHNTSVVERLLCSINELLETRVRLDARLRQQTDKNQQMMSEWMIAAAVIDRFCFIVFSLCFLIGTAVLFILATLVED